MKAILQKRIEEAAEKYAKQFEQVGYDDDQIDTIEEAVIYGATFALQNQWISVEEALPDSNKPILVNKGSEYAFASYQKDGFYLIGENHKMNSVTHWMSIPELKGGEK